MIALQHYCKYLAIFKPCISTLDHFPILTQPSRLSVCDLRPLSALRSDPLYRNRLRLMILRLSLPDLLSEKLRFNAYISVLTLEG
jgi:hypothetical protein